MILRGSKIIFDQIHQQLKINLNYPKTLYRFSKIEDIGKPSKAIETFVGFLTQVLKTKLTNPQNSNDIVFDPEPYLNEFEEKGFVELSDQDYVGLCV